MRKKSLYLKRTATLFTLLISVNMLSAQKFISLQDAMDIALTESPDLQQSILSVDRTQALLNAQRATMKSQFGLTVDPFSYSQQRTFDEFNNVWNTTSSYGSEGTFTVSQRLPWTDGTIALSDNFGWSSNYSEYNDNTTETFSNNLYLSISQPLFTYNTLKVELKQVELEHENAMLSYAMLQLNMERNVSQYFYDVYMAQMNLNIADEEYNNTLETYNITENKVEAGLSAKEELYQAELNLATAESSKETAKVTLEDSKDSFKQYIGLPLGESVSVMAEVNIDEVAIDVERALENGLASRMEIREREIELENSQFDMLSVKANNAFDGDLSLSIGLIGENENLGDIYDNPTQNPRVSLSLNIPLFDWGERKSRIKAQETTIRSRGIDYDQEKIDIELNIRAVYRSLNNLRRQIDIAKTNEKNAQLTYNINLEKYKNGDLTGMDLNLYQTQLSEKKVSLIQAQINYKLELLNMKIQSLFDFERGVAVVPESYFGEYIKNIKK